MNVPLSALHFVGIVNKAKANNINPKPNKAKV